MNLDRIADQAAGLGYEPVLNNRGRRIGAGTQLPPLTHVVRDALDQEFEYRLLSAAAHGQTWALRQLSFVEADHYHADAKAAGFAAAFEKKLTPRGMRYISLAAIRALAAAAWHVFRYSAWSTPYLTDMLEERFDEFDATEEVRFWRS